jgi:hypothetical protein
LKALEKTKFEEREIVLILISSLMAWKGTPNKTEEQTPTPVAKPDDGDAQSQGSAKKSADGALPSGDVSGADEDNIDRAPDGMEDMEGQLEDPDLLTPIPDFVEEVMPKKVRKKFTHLPFTEQDYALRDPCEEYRIIKEIEDEVLNFKKEGVKTYVISAGILYGKGEAIFNQHIQKAWL